MKNLTAAQERKKCETKMQQSLEKDKLQSVTNHNSSASQSKEMEVTKNCVRCGLSDHFYNDPICDALKQKCGHCRKPGHFTRMCWDLNIGTKRPRQDDRVKIRNKIPKLSIEPRRSEYEIDFINRNPKYSSETSKTDDPKKIENFNQEPKKIFSASSSKHNMKT